MRKINQQAYLRTYYPTPVYITFSFTFKLTLKLTVIIHAFEIVQQLIFLQTTTTNTQARVNNLTRIYRNDEGETPN